MFLNNYDTIPWEALRYMAAEANYGGRVTDPMDRRSINMILEDFYTPDILNSGFKISGLDKYITPDEGPLSTYITFIREELPYSDETAVFGLHDNADITSAINDTT